MVLVRVLDLAAAEPECTLFIKPCPPTVLQAFQHSQSPAHLAAGFPALGLLPGKDRLSYKYGCLSVGVELTAWQRPPIIQRWLPASRGRVLMNF